MGEDELQHTEEGCWCNPVVVTVEGEELCIHNSNDTRAEEEVPDFMREG